MKGKGHRGGFLQTGHGSAKHACTPSSMPAALISPSQTYGVHIKACEVGIGAQGQFEVGPRPLSWASLAEGPCRACRTCNARSTESKPVPPVCLLQPQAQPVLLGIPYCPGSCRDIYSSFTYKY